MEGMRAFAALLVFFAHFHTPFEARLQQHQWLYSAFMIGGLSGQAGVDVFFVLSGYLMYGATIKGRAGYWSFLGRRVRRIYPTFIAVFVLYIILSFAFPYKSKIPPGAHAIVFLTYNFFMLPGIFPLPLLILPAWSLSYEWLFYLTMPLVVSGLRMRGWTWLKRLAFFGVLFIGIVIVRVYPAQLQYHRLALFGIGIAIWEINRRYGFHSRFPRFTEWALLALLIADLVALGWVQLAGPPDQLPWFWTPSLSLILLPFVAASLFGGGVLTSIFSWAPLRWIGNFSYSYYLIHSIAIQGFKLVVDKYFPHSSSIPFLLFLFISSLALSLIAGALLYLCVERPLQAVPRPSKATHIGHRG
jgi:peptidoglycan/LPS O-acetylase OafA/YrhL